MYSLLDMCKSTQDVLLKQTKQEIAMGKCKNKVDCMTEEIETLKRITTEDARPKQASSRAQRWCLGNRRR